VETDALVRDYLGRLEAAAWPLGADRRRELVAEVREHIESALAEANHRDEVTTRNVLDRLGAPEEIVAAEVSGDRPGGFAESRVAVGQRLGLGFTEIAAIGLLTVGAVFLPFVGPMLGLIFVWASDQWTTRHKTIATVIVIGMLLVPILFLFGARLGAGPF
jgi:uncharacterized membrane protein